MAAEDMDRDDPRLEAMMAQDGVTIVAPLHGPGLVIMGHASGIGCTVLIPWDQLRPFIGNLMDVQDHHEQHLRDAHGG